MFVGIRFVSDKNLFLSSSVKLLANAVGANEDEFTNGFIVILLTSLEIDAPLNE